mmetsp:Transcript_3551/g.3496  ORF Transcript_3551/g.3496 Transcript_3551/m.3496 type:complete len:96 (+) Transcript_3551:336-623(+)
MGTTGECYLDSGSYTLWVEGSHCSLCTYSSQELQVRKVKSLPTNMGPLLEQFLSACASQMKENQLYPDPHRVLRATGIKASGCDYGFIYYHNNSG